MPRLIMPWPLWVLNAAALVFLVWGAFQFPPILLWWLSISGLGLALYVAAAIGGKLLRAVGNIRPTSGQGKERGGA